MITEYLNYLNNVDTSKPFLTEAQKRTSRSTTSRQTKIKRAVGQLSTAQARKNNDSMYKQMKFYCEKCKEFREKIHKKYGSRNKSRAAR